MKKKSLTICLIVCAVLAAALLLSVVALASSKPDPSAPENEEQVLQDQPLPEQPDAPTGQIEFIPIVPEESYCTLVIDTWSVEDGILTASTFLQAVMSESSDFTARVELLNGDVVLAAHPVTLDAGEAGGIYEADVTVQFEIPELSAEDELQLWLVVEPAGGDALYYCGADWYLEDGTLMLITG